MYSLQACAYGGQMYSLQACGYGGQMYRQGVATKSRWCSERGMLPDERVPHVAMKQHRRCKLVAW